MTEQTTGSVEQKVVKGPQDLMVTMAESDLKELIRSSYSLGMEAALNFVQGFCGRNKDAMAKNYSHTLIRKLKDKNGVPK